MKDTMADRLREARVKAGFEHAADAARAFGWEIPAYRHHENGTRAFDVEAAKRYARAFRVNPGWLLALDKVEAAPIAAGRERIVEVTGSVAAGVWQETAEWPQSDRFEIVVEASPFPKARRFGLRVDGYSMDQDFAPGTLLDCISIFDISIAPESGDFVIVERVRSDGMRELTVKQYQRDEDGRTWLLPRSTKPEFQSPIEVGTPDHDHNGDDRVQVIAYVIGSYQPHASRLIKMARKNGFG
jgi:phage repressor protein C with HTH and peptisase S24 domain